MSEDMAVVRLVWGDGRLRAEHVPEAGTSICEESVQVVIKALDEVLGRWATQRPGGYAVPCWEEAVRDTLHLASDTTSFPAIQDREGRISFSPFGRVFVRSTSSNERTGFRLRCAGDAPDRAWNGNPYSFFYPRDRQEWDRILQQMEEPLRVVRPIAGADGPGTPWLQTDGGTVDRTSDSPFRFLARCQYDLFAHLARKRFVMYDRELLVLDQPSGTRHALCALHEAFAEVTLSSLRFETLLRAMDILGITKEVMLAHDRADPPLELKEGNGPYDVLEVNHPLDGRLSWAAREVRCRFFLGGDRKELAERHTFHTLWEKYGLAGMTLETYLELRRPQE